MIAVAYCRYSSEAQRGGYSIEAQTRAINDWASKNGHIIKDYYIDEAKSGTSDDRDQFRKMIKDSASNSFEAVVVHKLDRFARDRYDSAVYRHKLKQNGVRVLSVLEPLDDSPESIIMESVLEGMAEYYSKNLAREVMKGKKEAARKAQYVGGFIPLGYDVDKNKHYIINDEEAKLVRELYTRFVGGDTLTVISKDFIARGIKGKQGGEMSQRTLTNLISNPLYCGKFVFGKTSKTNEPIQVDGIVPPIVSVQMWEEANAKFHKLGPRKKDPSYLLTGYLFSTCCNKPYVGNVSYTNYKTKAGESKTCETRTYIKRYSCGECKAKHSIKKQDLEDFVIGSIENVLFDGSTLDWVVTELTRKLKERIEKNSNKNGMESLHKELENIKSQKEKLLDIYLSGVIDKAVFSSRTSELTRNEQIITERLKSQNTAKIEVPTVSILKEALKKYLSSASSDSLEYKQRLLAVFVDRITIDSESITIYFRFPIPGVGESHTVEVNKKYADKPQGVKTLFNLSAKFPLTAVKYLDYSSVSILNISA